MDHHPVDADREAERREYRTVQCVQLLGDSLKQIREDSDRPRYRAGKNAREPHDDSVADHPAERADHTAHQSSFESLKPRLCVLHRPQLAYVLTFTAFVYCGLTVLTTDILTIMCVPRSDYDSN